MQLPNDVIAQVERRLDVRLDRSSLRTGAWAESAGYRTNRGTWVRVDSRPLSVIQPQSWVGAEAAAVIPDVPKPAWLQSATWADASRGRVWRAEEMELVTEPVVAVTGTMLTAPPVLPDTWWAQLRAALAALASFRTLRVSGRQELITRRISQVLGGAVDTTVTEWATSHGDLHWGNLTAPGLSLLDWADWGLAPRGNDAACLWGSALAVPDTAERVHAEFRDDLDRRSGKIARLWVCSNILRMVDQRADARDLAEPARAAADQLVTDLR
ncbi:MAG TPA: hypothetical protein VK887_11495 [Pseudonocardiaceae bacterium]|nr:hypothetical protein [Pseudonocardiaceae bacterium]